MAIPKVQAQQIYALTRTKQWHLLHKVLAQLMLRNSAVSLRALLQDADRSLTIPQMNVLIAEPDRIDKVFGVTKSSAPGNVSANDTQVSANDTPKPNKPNKSATRQKNNTSTAK